MAWDATRPIPWRRSMREAAIFLVIGGVALTLLVKHNQLGTYLGLVIGMIFYVAFVAVLVEVRLPAAIDSRSARAPAGRHGRRPTAVGADRRAQRPAPTRRTSTGPSQRPNRSTKKRRR